MTREGLILKGVGGFYTVYGDGSFVVCKPRGVFRKEGIRPLPGDHVSFSIQADGLGRIDAILPRRNRLKRPPVANVDQLVVIISQAIPQSDPYLIDRILASAEMRAIDCLLLINKIDLADGRALQTIYERAGFPVHPVSAKTGDGLEAARAAFTGCVIALAGNSGVGKSSLLNALYPALALPVGEVSIKGGRGRHTTRHVELLPLGNGHFLADTPGFSLFDADPAELTADTADTAFREFRPFLGACRFTGCRHERVDGCAVYEAVRQGLIDPSRFDSYLKLLEEVKAYKPWEKKNPPG